VLRSHVSRQARASPAAARGETIFKGKASCTKCHVPPLFTEPGWYAHKPSEIGIDDFQSVLTGKNAILLFENCPKILTEIPQRFHDTPFWLRA